MNRTEDKKLEETLKREIYPVLPESIIKSFSNIKIDELNGLEEIRLRATKPLMIQKNGSDYFIDSGRSLTKQFSDNLIRVSAEEISKALLIMSNYSIYAIEDELKQGFITIKGGHRVGFVGKAVTDGSNIRVIKNISSMNIRIAREVKGCSNVLIKEIYFSGFKNTLIISPPGCGKTTLLRDIVRNLSNGVSSNDKGFKICVIDERSEIAGCYMGIPQKDIGVRTDVLDACPKSAGIYLSLRSMSPEIIAVDEIGSEDELPVLKYAMNCGVKLIATAHGNDYEDILRRRNIKEMFDSALFQKLIFLSRRYGPCTIEKIVDIERGGVTC